MVNLKGRRQGTADGLTQLAKTGGIPDLRLNYSDVNDAGLAPLAPLTKVADLRLDDAGITESGLLRCASNVTEIKHLSLRGTHLAARGPWQLAPQLPDLEFLHCPNLGADPNLPEALEGFPRLKTLKLQTAASEKRTSESGVRKLAEFRRHWEVYWNDRRILPGANQ
jgi:hypothetical protein